MAETIRYVDVIYSKTATCVALRCGAKSEHYENVPGHILVRIAEWATKRQSGQILPRWNGWTWQGP